MHRLSNWHIALLLTLGGFLSSVCHAESPNDILVIANKKIKIDSITPEELKQIFLKKKTTWINGDRIICINAPSTSAERAIFREKILGMSENEENTYWEKQKIKRQLTSPSEMRSIVKAVFKLSNGISYAYRKDVPPNVVKVLYVIPE